MYLFDFVNAVRGAQGYEPLERMPLSSDPRTSPLELAMGCRLEGSHMRLASPDRAAAVSAATGLPVGYDGETIDLPPALEVAPVTGDWALA